VKQIRGRGLLNAVVIADGPVSAWDICMLMKERGLLAKPTHDTIIRFAPPLVITREQLDDCVRIISSSIRDIATMPRDQIPRETPVH